MNFYVINYTVDIGEKYIGIAAVCANSPASARNIFMGDSTFNGSARAIKITQIKQVNDRYYGSLSLEEYVNQNALQILKLNDIVVANGKSAYQIAQEYGFQGTEKEWLDSLNGVPPGGEDGQVLVKKGNVSYAVEWKDLQADKSYVHTQLAADSVWHIEHNLNKFPSVSVVDSGKSTVVGDVTYIDENNITIKFNSQFAGKAFLN